MLKSNEYFYNDEYMYFTFNTTHSSKYNLIIQNDIDDLKIYADRGSKVDFLQPANQTGQYMLGVSHPQRQFPLKLVAQNLNRRDIREVTKWLETGTVGTLSFDYAPDWEYDVVVSSLTDPNIYPLDDELFVMTVEVTFVTMEEAIAHNMNDGILDIKPSDFEEKSIIFAPIVSNNLPIPPFSVEKTNTDNVYSLKIFFLGNQKATLNIVAYDTRGSKTTDATTYAELVVSIPDILERQGCKAHIVYPKDTIPNTYILEYNNLSNSFLINGKLAETKILNNELVGKTSEADKSYTHFIYNPTGIAVQSPGEPMLINDYDEDELEQLASTGRKYFVCSVKEKELSNSIYYIPSTIQAKDKYDFKFVYNDNDKIILNPEYENHYFGYYQTIQIKAENYTKLTFTIRQYNNTL